MQLKEIRWEDLDGDKYEGIELSRVQSQVKITSDRLLALTEEAVVEVGLIIQTAYHPMRKGPYGAPIAEKTREDRKLDELLISFLERKFRLKFEIMISRLTEECDIDRSGFRVFSPLRYEIVGPFDYTSQLTNKNTIVRFLSLYARSVELLEDLEKESLSRDQLLKDSRLRECVKFLGKKGEDTLNLVSTMDGPILANLRKLIDFYL